MKKIIPLFFAFCICCNTSYSQLTKKNWLVGGTGLFSSQSENLNGTNIKGLDIEISPNIGYFFSDKFAGGARVNYTYSNVKYPGVSNSVSHLGFGPFLRYYFLNTAKSVNLFAESYYQYTIVSSANSTSKESLIRFSGGPVIFFNSSVGLEFTVNYQLFKGDDVDAKKIFLGIGFQIHLEKEKN